MKAPAKIATIPATDSASATPRPIFILRQSQLAMASKIAPSTTAAKTSMKNRVSSITRSATPTSASTISVAPAIRPAPNAGSGAPTGLVLLCGRAGEAAGAGVFSVIAPPYRRRCFAQPYASP